MPGSRQLIVDGSQDSRSAVRLYKSLAVAAIAALASLGLGACSSSGSSSGTSQYSASEQQFISDLSSLNNADLNRSSTSVILGLGHAVCTDLDNGYTVPQVVNDGMSVVNSGTSGLTASDIGTLIATAVPVFCPQYTASVRQQVQNLG